MPLILATIQCWHILPLLRMNLLEENVTISCRKCCFHVASLLRETKIDELVDNFSVSKGVCF
ncbi:hypothetical protein U9M48_044327 [Paspalum notatum var. saurae]|uniref:Uncharacterized protein n=1 Tax=Paspalum notatum var. saurae TaxID=547442 RepID=A0AAQ3UZF0_PASNO